MVLGMIFGMIVGSAFDRTGLGMALGLVCGLCLGGAVGRDHEPPTLKRSGCASTREKNTHGPVDCAGRGDAGICLVLLLVALFPANVYAAMNGVTLGGEPASALWWGAPLQLFWRYSGGRRSDVHPDFEWPKRT